MKKIIFLVLFLILSNNVTLAYNLNFNPFIKYGSVGLLVFTAPTSLVLGYHAYESFQQKEYLKGTAYTVGALYGLGLTILAIFGLKEFEK